MMALNLGYTKTAAPQNSPACMGMRRSDPFAALEPCGEPSTVVVKRTWHLGLLYLCDACAGQWR